MAGFLFLLKKIATALVLPLSLSLLLWLMGLALLWRRPWGRLGKGLMVLGLLILLAASLPLTGGLLIQPLEQDLQGPAQPAALAQQGVEYIVVLGGGMRPGREPLAERLSTSSLRRLLEGVRLWQGLPGVRLVLSEGGIDPEMSCAEAMARLAQGMGVPRAAMLLEEKSWDTEDQARNLAPLLAGRSFALVTSAYHMRRAMWLFGQQGMQPIPAPVDFHSLGPMLSYQWFLPSSNGLGMVDLALREYLGQLWVRFRGLLAGREPLQEAEGSVRQL